MQNVQILKILFTSCSESQVRLVSSSTLMYKRFLAYTNSYDFFEQRRIQSNTRLHNYCAYMNRMIFHNTFQNTIQPLLLIFYIKKAKWTSKEQLDKSVSIFSVTTSQILILFTIPCQLSRALSFKSY